MKFSTALSGVAIALLAILLSRFTEAHALLLAFAGTMLAMPFLDWHAPAVKPVPVRARSR